jgi:hypothetical protein
MRSSLPCVKFILVALCISIAGCGSGSGTGNSIQPPPPVSPGFSLAVSNANLSVSQGTRQAVQIAVTAQGSFAGSVTVTLDGLPTGVTFSPSVITASASSPATITFSASSAAVISQQNINIWGQSGTLVASASMKLTVQGASVPDPFHFIGGALIHGFYDQQRQLLFVTNPGLNEVDVLSGVDLSLKSRITVPQPVGIDQMVDGKTLVVGTASQQLVTLDENTYAVTSHPISADGFQNAGMFFPTVAAMANGKVFAIGQIQGLASNDGINGGQAIFQWDPVADTVKQIRSASSNPLDDFGTDNIVSSSDHKWAVFSSDQFYLYSSDTDSLTSIPLAMADPPNDQFGVRGYALNGDGSMIAIASAYQVTFFDRSFNSLGTAILPVAYQYGSGMEFSADGAKLYLQYSIALTLEVVDVASHTATGYISATVAPDYDLTSGLLAANANGRALLNINGGIRSVSLSQTPVPNPSVNGYQGPLCRGIGGVLPLNTVAQVSTVAQNSASIYVGGQPVLLSGGGSVYTIPASSIPGPADMECIDTNGDTAVRALEVSYGVLPVGLSANLIPPTGNTGAYLFGFGFSTNPTTSTPTVTVGGVTSPKVVSLLGATTGTLQGVAIAIPGGSPGQTVDIGISSPLGNGTLSAAARYYPTPKILPASGILQITFDKLRNQLYVLKAGRVEILDASSLTWQPGIDFSGIYSGTVTMMGLAPDGSKLAVLAVAQNQLQIIALDPSGAFPPSVSSHTDVNASVNSSIAMTNLNTALIRGSPVYAFDFSTRVFSALPSPVYPDVIRASPDGSRIYGARSDSGSAVYSFDPTTWAVRSGGPSWQFWTDLAVFSDGSQFAAVATQSGASGDHAGFYNPNLQYLNSNVYPDFSPPDDRGVMGAAFSPGGKVLVVPLGDSIEFWDVSTGTLRARLMTPEELVPAGTGDPTAPMMALNAAGDTIYAVSASGVSVIPLPGPIDQMVPVQWPNLTVIGNIFSSHSTANVSVKTMMRKRSGNWP